MKPIEKKKINLRILIVGFFFSLIFLTIIIKAAYLQIWLSPWLARKAAKQYERTIVIRGKRGTIYDANYREMAVSTEATSIAAYPCRITDTATTAKLLAPVLGLNQKRLRFKLISRKPFLWIKRQVSPKEEKAVRELGLEGIDFIPEHSRFYPNSFLAAQVIGFTGIDGTGLEGIEFSYDSFLRGKELRLTVLTDALGKKFDREDGKILYGGNNLVLTIDRTIQYIAETALGDAVKEYSAKSGVAIVMVPKTGAILAMANYPLFNPNSFGRFPREFWRNRAVTDAFEPGSTMKVFSASAAIESGGCTPNTIFYCEKGLYKIGDDIIHDTHPYGWLSLQKIIKFSSNIGAVKLSEMIGPKSLYETLDKFGFGKKTGLKYPGETSGDLNPYAKWTKIDTGTIAFGHGISVSAIQLITAVCAIANKGVLMKPYIVSAITDRNGRHIKQFTPCKIRRVISEKTADTVKMMMKTVVEKGGTGHRAALEGYTVCGKTGTAQKLNKYGSYANDAYIASFVGFVPEKNPQIAILVVVDEPRGSYYGGTVAAPAFRKIAKETLNYLNVPPEKSGDNLTAQIKKETNG